MEDEDDKLQHWVVSVGKNHLRGTDIECLSTRNGIVLDSDRGYKFWKIEPEQTQLYFRRQQAQQDAAIWWISSFVSVTVNERKPWESEHFEGPGAESAALAYGVVQKPRSYKPERIDF
jgi:hypothetical protein